MDPRIGKLAEVMVDYSLSIKKGDSFKIRGPQQALPLIKEVYRLALKRGANPYVEYTNETLSELMLKEASDEQLKYVHPLDIDEAKMMDAYLHIWCSENTKFLSNVDPSRQAIAQSARKEFLEIFFRRVADGSMRWCGTLFPDQADAQEAEKSLSEYEDFVYSAGYCDTADPVSHWKRISAEQAKLCTRLNKLSTIRVKSADTDLRLKVAGRKWINCDGKENFPDGEVFTSPLEDSTNGVITYTYPACYGGRQVENVRLTFKDGVVTEFSAAKNQDYLQKMLEMDAGAKRVGEFAIGTNYHIQTFSKNILFDEKIGGTCHLAVGNSIYESGGVNQSALHWDMVCELRKGGEIFGDDELIYKDGKFVPGFAD
jgi:aminopeptidase